MSDSDPLVQLLRGRAGLADRRYPLALFADGSILEGPERFMLTRYVEPRPTGAPSSVSPEDERAYAETARFKQQLAERVGLPTRPTRETYDVVVVGAGPAGLTAALYGASEGLRHARRRSDRAGRPGRDECPDRELPGLPERGEWGRARGEHPRPGIRLGAEILIGAELLTAAPTDQGTFRVELTSGSVIEARTGVAATGVEYRRLEAPGVEKFVGAGIHYGSAPGEAVRLEGRDVIIVGGGNSAGQAALHMAEHARAVTVVVRATKPAARHVELPRRADKPASTDRRSNVLSGCRSTR